MSDINDGGPAFPCPQDGINQNSPSLGMTLRDYFAAKAMVAIVLREIDEWPFGIDASSLAADRLGIGEQSITDEAATCAYTIADAMLKARK